MSLEYNLMAALRKTPSVPRWKGVLARLTNGEFDAYIERVGTVDEFVRTNIAESNDSSRAAAAFASALEQLVASWQPAERQPYFRIERMLELIRSFTPAGGFEKVLGQLEAYGRFLPDSEEDTPIATLERLKLLGLVALQNYYPVAAAQKSAPGFAAYVSYLRRTLENGQLAPHACRRLLELRELEFGSPEVAQLVNVHPQEFLKEALKAFVYRNTSLKARAISELYRVCLLSDRISELNQALDALGARIEHTWPPRFVASNGEIVSVTIARDVEQKYMKVRLSEGELRGTKVMTALAGRG